MIVWKLSITLHEPASIGEKPLTGNQTPTLSYIPATALRGALAQALSWDQRLQDIPRWFGGSEPRWSHAWPASSDDIVVSLPRCFVSEKDDDGFRQDSVYGIHNTLDGPPPESTNEKLHEWKAFREGLMVIDGQGTPLEVWTGTVAVGMHVSLSHVRQTNRLGQLFSREELMPDTKYTAWVMDPGEILDDMPLDIVIGKRRSAGNGMAYVTASAAAALPWPKQTDTKTGEARVQLLTNAVVPGPSGGYLRGFDDTSLTKLLGVPVRVERAASAFRPVPGWSGAWGMPREQALAISAGSVWHICSDAPGFAAALARVEQEGLGIRRGEGFGWLVVNPAWLYFGRGRKGSAPPRTGFQTSTPPSDFPGTATIARRELQWLVRRAPEIAAKTKETQLRGAAQYALRVDTIGKLEAFLQQMAERNNKKRAWIEVQSALKDVFDKAGRERITAVNDIAGLRFLLDAALVCAEE
jgi:hypothetical protein